MLNVYDPRIHRQDRRIAGLTPGTPVNTRVVEQPNWYRLNRIEMLPAEIAGVEVHLLKIPRRRRATGRRCI
jgi:hypothetical protein